MDFIKQKKGNISLGSTRRKFLFGLAIEALMIIYFMESKSFLLR